MTNRPPMHVSEGAATPWKRWFAWRPVRTEQQTRVWLRPTWRRRYYPAPWFIMEAQGGWWEYSDVPQGRWGF